MTFRTLDGWPGARTDVRKRGTFRTDYNGTLKLLDRELRHLGAHDVMILADCDARHIRLDGQLRAEAQLRSPGIVLAFQSKFGPLKYACDRYQNWNDNLHAIGLGLEALRAVDRHGISRRGEQYKGYAALPSPGSNGLTREQAAAVIAREAGIPGGGSMNTRTAIAEAIKRAHPDQGGTAERLARVMEARKVLEGGA